MQWNTFRASTQWRLPSKYRRILVTGGAGFIGSHVTDHLVNDRRAVTVFDDLSNPCRDWLGRATGDARFELVEGDVVDLEAVASVVAGKDLVIHLAGNADIIGGPLDTDKDLRSAAVGTRNVLEGMRRHEVRDLLFTSSGAVYGDGLRPPTSEDQGPLLPVSLYGAGKVAAEAFISAYCHMFGLRAWIFRLGNVVGGRMSRGVIRDFALKLTEGATKLTVLGDGHQRKSYLLIEDCIAGMWFGLRRLKLSDARPCVIVNLAGSQTTSVLEIAGIVKAALGRTGVANEITGGRRGWPGDQPYAWLNPSRMEALGWRAGASSTGAIKQATARMVEYLGLRPVGKTSHES